MRLAYKLGEIDSKGVSAYKIASLSLQHNTEVNKKICPLLVFHKDTDEAFQIHLYADGMWVCQEDQ